MNRNRRRQLVVNKALQSRIIFATAWAPGLCLAVAAVVLGVFCVRLHNEALKANVSLPSVLPVFVIAVCFVLVATIYILFPALQLSHRIAGPTYNIGNTLRKFRDGDITTRVHLRDHDYLVEVQDSVNEFLDWLEEHPPKDYVPVKTTVSSQNEDSETGDAAPGAAANPETSPQQPEVARTTAGEGE